ncbi:hypothetical protein SAMN05216480_112115 [Pustulibacterium marinum]|uniref:Uncharacterized protein n=1 Tax=Pustulibacterium marinum TaxID=1224947 RepID=A0A1I7I304_9FLAO|nr:hypothetical protein [Pustulibacterium marinum]SFU67277.1 hypothetical protein SAMN05216480_112115 [Pustulibacterium marinum]
MLWIAASTVLDALSNVLFTTKTVLFVVKYVFDALSTVLFVPSNVFEMINYVLFASSKTVYGAEIGLNPSKKVLILSAYTMDVP